jgi:hypothetical protein
MKTETVQVKPVLQGGVALVKGERKPLIQRTLRLAGKLIENHNVLFVDGENVFNRHYLTEYLDLKPEEVTPLMELFVEFPQDVGSFRHLIYDELEKDVVSDGVGVIILSSIKSLFFTPDMNDEDAAVSLDQAMAWLKRMTEKHNLITLVLDFPEEYNERDAVLSKLLELNSSVEWAAEEEPEEPEKEVALCRN